MQEKYCVFLRGINVNGIKIKMEALVDAFNIMGFSEARTILATGNVVISYAQNNREDLKPHIEKGLAGYFNYDAYVFLRSFDEIKDIFLTSQTLLVPEGFHCYYLLCDNDKLPSELKQIFDTVSKLPDEQFILHNKGAFWLVPKGSTLSSNFGSKILGEKKYKAGLTSRNISTIEKVYKATQI